MKKMFFTALAVCLLSISAFAVDGKIGMIKIDAVGDKIIIGIVDANNAQIAAKKLVGTDDKIKAALAVALTAKSLNANVTLVEVSGAGGWSNVIMR